VRSDMYLCAVNSHLTAKEANDNINNSGTRAVVTSVAKSAAAVEMMNDVAGCPVRLADDSAVDGFGRYEEAIATSTESAPPPCISRPRRCITRRR
jgi:long-chain acyl-CoA synthetase